MPKAFWIAHVTVTDEEAYSRYVKIATEAVTSHGGRFVARAGRHIQKEGRDHPRNVVAEFPSLEAANECYESDLYQEALKIALPAADRDLVLVECAE